MAPASSNTKKEMIERHRLRYVLHDSVSPQPWLKQENKIIENNGLPFLFQQYVAPSPGRNESIKLLRITIYSRFYTILWPAPGETKQISEITVYLMFHTILWHPALPQSQPKQDTYRKSSFTLCFTPLYSPSPGRNKKRV